MEPQQSRRLELTPEELAIVARRRASSETVKVDENWLFVSEFGYYFGWEGVQAIRNNDISLEEAATLLQGAIKVWCGKLVQQAQTTFLATRTASLKNGQKELDKALGNYMKTMKADK